MAKSSDAKPKSGPGAARSIATWTVTGLLIAGLTGFGAANFGNTVSSVGSVGSIDIPVRDYVQAVRDEASRFSQQMGTQLGAQQAISLGLDRQAIAALVTRGALDNAALKAGLSVGDATVAQEIMKQRAFIGSSGSFDQAVYRSRLNELGLRESDFEANLRRDVARSILTGAVSGGFAPNEAATEALYKWVAERRSFTLIRLNEADLTAALATPDEAAIRAYYDANIATFTRPEAKRLRYAVLLPEAIAADLPVEEAAIRKMYDARIAEYVVPPRRLVERLVYPDDAALEAAQTQLAAGTSFEDLVAARGLTMDAVDMGDVSEAELGAAGPAVFAANEGAVVSTETSLGPTLFRINGVLPGEETSFEEAHDDLAQEVRLEEARHQINVKIDEIDDLLAGGATLDDLASQTGMTTGQLDFIATAGPGTQSDNKLEGYQAFRTAASALQQGDFPEAVVLDDGGVVALEFVEMVPPAPIPFEEAKPEVEASMQQIALREALTARADALKAEAEAGADFATLGNAEKITEVSRDGATTNLSADLLGAAFEMAAGEVRVVSSGNATVIVHLDTITAAPDSGDEAEALKAAISSQLEMAVSNDASNAFTTAMAEGAGISIDQNAINLVNAGLQ
ncbi:peptidylprolyl isomerase [Xinfangfangia sp. D13-10-4-6]|uniref:peptidylprolyl isomerase n=1 Tax=Pseudogemmobacter hezensis TaxID=2737662 RepID=UPI0015516EB6|nr:peptidyl-prolyl cis-trans isomerase [Pseudogemmobacter hezensis]NPD16251.1 peptidylprolyl isomerase [Pseudogemmobacter hezensis]